jgi:hypothetical protein
MSDWLDALTAAWDALAHEAPKSREFRSRLVAPDAPLAIRAGMRAADGAPCLMLPAVPVPDALFELGGMRPSPIRDDAGPFLVLSLEDGTRRDLFSTICADVISAAAAAETGAELGQFLARLDAWRQFLRDRRDGLSKPETIGLIGELLVLERILAADNHGLPSWQSPNDGLHDFLRGGHALEVKTGVGPSPVITISALDQLDNAGLRALDLLHVRLIEEPRGGCLRDLIEAVAGTLPDDAARRSFENALLRRGLMPDDDAARSAPRVQLRSIDAYAVSDTFPRLTRAALPVAITDATYKLEVRALTAFSADLDPLLEAFIQGGQQ